VRSACRCCASLLAKAVVAAPARKIEYRRESTTLPPCNGRGFGGGLRVTAVHAS
jgi:hypothetical protein